MNNIFEQAWKERVLLVLVIGLCVGPGADLAIAGQAQEASIIGQVTDESGAVLPGVTVTAKIGRASCRERVSFLV